MKLKLFFFRFLIALLLLLVAMPGHLWAKGFGHYLANMLNNQPALKASLYDIYSKGQFYDVAVSQMINPSITSFSSFGRIYQETAGSTNDFFNTRSRYDQNRIGFELKQNIFNGGVDHLNTQQGRANFHLSEWQYLATEQNLILESATVYSNVIKARESYRVQQWSNQLMGRTLAAARIRFRAGAITRSDLTQSEALKASNDAMLITSKANLDSANDEFQRLFGEMPDEELDKIEPLLSKIVGVISSRTEGEAGNWLGDFEKRNPTLQQARLQREIAHIQKDMNLNSALPKIDFVLQGSMTTGDRSNFPQTSKVLSGVVTISGPLWVQGSLLSGSRGVISAAKVADFQFANTRQQLNNQFRKSYRDYQVAQLSEKAFLKAVEASRLAVKAANSDYVTGKRTVLDLLQAIDNNSANEINLLNAQQNKVLATLSLLSMTGDLLAPQFGLASPYLITEKNRNYKGAADPFSVISEWLFSMPEEEVLKTYPKQFEEKESK